MEKYTTEQLVHIADLLNRYNIAEIAYRDNFSDFSNDIHYITTMSAKDGIYGPREHKFVVMAKLTISIGGDIDDKK